MRPRNAAIGTAATFLALMVPLRGCSSDNADTSSSAGTTQSASSDASQALASQSSAAATSASSSDAAGASGEADQAPGALASDADLSKRLPKVSAQQAIDAALKKADGTVHAVELDYSKSSAGWQYDVKILDGTTDHKFTVDATSGEVVKRKQESTDDREKGIYLSSPLSYVDAFKLAQGKASGRLESWKLEYDDGHVAYQFDFVNGSDEQEVTVDVNTKQVTLDH